MEYYKTIFILLIISSLGLSEISNKARIQEPAPNFEGTAVIDKQFVNIKLSDYEGKYLVLFFYPLDFTYVCPTEIIAFSESAEDFANINCTVIAVSCDSHFTHLAWVNTPRKFGGIEEIKIPLLADKTGKIARDYGVYNEKIGIPFRGLFVIDGEQIVRHITINDLGVGRSVNETLRIVQAFQYTDMYGEVCPANWEPGKKSMTPNQKGLEEYFA